jgi:hypothetical protein
VVTTGTTLGIGARMMTFLTPTPDSDNTSVILGEGCDVLDFGAELTSLTPVNVSKEGTDTLDWSNLAIPGVTRVMLGFYEGMTAADLEEEVLDLMLIADRKWELTVESRAEVALTDFEDDEGHSFDGFEGEGSWVFALLCDTCQNPAPPFVTLLQPE